MAVTNRWLGGMAIAFVSVVTLVAAWTLVLRHRGLADIVAGPVPPLMVSSPAFLDNGTIPGRFTCQAAGNDAGKNGAGEAGTSPPLMIAAVPPATKTLAIMADDADAPLGFVHWIAFNIAPDLLQIPEGAGSAPALLHGGINGVNDFGSNTYAGPCPPAGTHHYRFHIYALDALLSLPAGATKQQLSAAASGHILAEGTLTAVYSRSPGP
jgi:Raf kinase inhibitor-like YbhB/YbcL family protein